MGALERLGLPEARWVDVGGPVHYREWDGPADGPTFVLVHGLGGSLLNWAPVAPGLARLGRVLAFDMAGFGLTPLGERETGVGANLRLLAGFLAALDLPPVVLVGNSMGGMLTMAQCARAPRTVERMVLVDAAFPRYPGMASRVSPRIAAGFAAVGLAGESFARWVMDSRSRRLGAEGLVRETLAVCTPNPSSIDPVLVEAMIEAVEQRSRSEDATRAFIRATRSIVQTQIRPARYRALVRAARCAALVIHGGRDLLVPVEAAGIAAAGHANWELRVFPDLGHIPMMEAPDRWLEAVGSWLDRTRAEAASI
jgi:pimeloyl-ACP methyl ester carboxylesterase